MKENTEKIIFDTLKIVGIAIAALIISLLSNKPIKIAKLPKYSYNSHEAKLQRNKFAYMNRQC